jgi:hypothetical protein
VNGCAGRKSGVQTSNILNWRLRYLLYSRIAAKIEMASMGGNARAKKLGGVRTKEIARKPQQPEWGKKKTPRERA